VRYFWNGIGFYEVSYKRLEIQDLSNLNRLFKYSEVKTSHKRGDKMVQLGKRYRCEACGTEILCTKAADGDPKCCEKEMELQQPNKEKSSD
jgi:hypothetical protein